MKSALIQFHKVLKQYPGNEFTLGEIDLQIGEGEFMFLIGPSGSGKTTLIKMLIREEAPSAGKIYFDDKDITHLSRSNIYKLRRQIGVIFQDYKLIPDKNAYENVAFAMEAAGRKDSEIKETVPYVLDIVGLSHRADAFPEQLSGGEKQRIAIARAVSNNPRVLIADEPTGNLDPAAAWDIVQILSKINNWGTTVIMSTHGTDIVNTLNKRVVQMHGGQIVRDDSKGTYEVTSKFEDSMLANVDDKPEDDKDSDSKSEKKKHFTVSIKAADDDEVKKAGKMLDLSWLQIWKRKDQMPVDDKPSLVDQTEGMSDLVDEANQDLENETELEIDSKGEAEQIIKDADNVPVSELKLRPEVIADLKTAGYHDVEDIIAAGPEKLAEELIIDPQEVVVISQAVSEFVKEEAEKLKWKDFKGKQNSKEEPKSEESRKSNRVKINLAGKKNS